MTNAVDSNDVKADPASWQIIDIKGFTIETTQAFRDNLVPSIQAIELSLLREIIESLANHEYTGMVTWTVVQQGNTVYVHDWPSYEFLEQFAFPGWRVSEVRAMALRFAARVEGNHAVLGLSKDPDPRMIDNHGRAIGDMLAIIGPLC
jgi:hypothetical protein